MRKVKSRLVRSTAEIVEDIFIAHPDWNATKVFAQYQLIQDKEHQVMHPSSIQKHLETVKGKYKQLIEKGLDAPWSMGSYAQNDFELRYKLTSQDNLAILRVRKMQLDREDISKSMSIRQALWIARLRAIVDYFNLDKTPEKKDYWLWMYSFQYAIQEKVAKLKKGEFNSRPLDDALAEGHERFKETYTKSVYANWKDYERFYISHGLNGPEDKTKEGAK